MPSETIWIVVADGSLARFLTRVREGVPLIEIGELTLTATSERRRRGRATSVHDGANHGRQVRPAHKNVQNTDELHFLRNVAGRVNLAVEEHAVGRLVLCAPPRALGILRDHLTAQARALVVTEIAKDLVREGVRDIDERLKPVKA
jgi:protein required for attachment to host cells